LIEELADPWLARQESALRERRGGQERLRAEGAEPNHRLPFVDRVIATLVIMRFQLPHAALAVAAVFDQRPSGLGGVGGGRPRAAVMRAACGGGGSRVTRRRGRRAAGRCRRC